MKWGGIVMVFCDFEISDRLRILCDEVDAMCGQRNIIIKIDDSLVPYGCDGCQEETKNGDLAVYSRNVSYSEAVISHEILHIYFIYKRYPIHDEIPEIDEVINLYGTILHNSVIHRLIVAEQKNMGFDLSQNDEALIKGFETWESEEKMDAYKILSCALTQTSALVLYTGNDLSVYLSERFPKSNAIALELLEIINEEKELTPFHVGRTVTKLYKHADKICERLGLPLLSLNTNIMINPVLSERQLDLMVEQVFDVCKISNINKYFLRLKSTGQNSMFLT